MISPKRKVTVVDYGIGNLHSVSKALERCGAEVVLADSPRGIAEAEHLILPGVGAFSDGMKELKDRGLIEPIKSFSARMKPFLGICLGMQMMFDMSLEFGEHAGLGLIPGKVVPIPNTAADGMSHKIPHIGWNEIIPSHENTPWESTILEWVTPSQAFYFVHSFMAEPLQNENRLADCHYNGRAILAVVRSGNLYGCQFHPEKSGQVGLEILRSFCELS